MVAATVGENNFQIGSAYFVAIYNVSVFVVLLISYLEMFALPTKASFVEHVANADDEIDRRSGRRPSQSSRSLPHENRTGEGSAQSPGAADDDEPTENTSLLRGSGSRAGKTFTKFGRRHQANTDETMEETDDAVLTKAYGDEQAWSSSLPRWTWIVQFLILVPINVVILGQISLLLTAALHQVSRCRRIFLVL